MKKKIIITIFIIIMIIQILMPSIANAFIEKYDITSTPARLEKYKAEEIVSETSGLDTKTGLILEPTVTLVTFVIDSIMEILTTFMTTNNFKSVMVNDKNKTADLEASGTTFTIEDMTPYKNFLGQANVEYPNFTYSPEEIFSGNVDLLDINFLDDSNTNKNWQNIRSIVSSWYKVIRMFAIIGLLSVLIYTGIRIIISSNATDKSKYKELFVNWFIAVFLLFTMHYIMAFILNVIEEITSLLQGVTGVIEVNAGGDKFTTNLIGLARFQLQQHHFSAKVTYLIIYVALVTYTFKFTLIYLKRVLKMAFLTLISPIVALTYPIDKMEGKAKGFEMWLKEYVYNALLQPMHYILYYTLVTSSLTLAAKNMIYAIAALLFISHAEKLLKKIFGFDKASGGTVGGLAGAYAAGAIASNVKNVARMSNGTKKNIKSKKSDNNEDIENFSGIRDASSMSSFTDEYSEGADVGNDVSPQTIEEDDEIEEWDPLTYHTMNENNEQNNYILGGSYVPTWQMPLMQQMAQTIGGNDGIEEWDPLTYHTMNENNGQNNYILGGSFVPTRQTPITQPISQTQQMSQMQPIPQTQQMSQMQPISQTQQMSQTQPIPQTQQISQIPIRDMARKVKESRQYKGVTHVAKTLAKPVWDDEKDNEYNRKRLFNNVVGNAMGVGIGITAAAVQAGISITDGKYNPMEGVAAFTAGMVGGRNIVRGINAVSESNKENSYTGDEERIKEYGKQWFNRDDVISKYNKMYPGKGKEMRRRAVNNYVSRGITDIDEQKKAINYANQLKDEKGINEDEADKIAIEVLKYKKGLIDKNVQDILFDIEKRNKYIDARVESYSGSKSKESVRRFHENFIQNVINFDKANG